MNKTPHLLIEISEKSGQLYIKGRSKEFYLKNNMSDKRIQYTQLDIPCAFWARKPKQSQVTKELMNDKFQGF